MQPHDPGRAAAGAANSRGGRDPEVFRPEDEDSELVCYCMRVREATLRRAIAAGVRSVEALGDLTRAGTGCGTCRSDLIRLLREHAEAER